MKPRIAKLALAAFAASAAFAAALIHSPQSMAQTSTASVEDPFIWLEEVLGEKPLAWVRERNADSNKVLTARAEYAPIKTQLLEVLNSKDRIPAISRRGSFVYNLWQDDKNKRGLWRRTSLAEYRKPQPAWETVIDLDALGKEEGENWVWAGATCLGPDYQRCLVSLSRGGADAKVVREFDTVSKQFVKDGFTLPEAKSDVDWIDANTIYVGTDFGPGSLTTSGYTRIVKRWKRGTPLSAASTVFEGLTTDVAANVVVDTTPGFERIWFSRSPDFFTSKVSLLQGDKLVPLDVPDDADIRFMREKLLLRLRSDLKVGDTTFASGSLLQTDAAAYLRGERNLKALFTPTATRSLSSYTATRDHLIINVLDNVVSKLELWQKVGGGFFQRDVSAPGVKGSLGTLSVSSLHDPEVAKDPLADNFLVTYTDFLTPETLYLGNTKTVSYEALKSRPAQFNADGMRAEQRFATSKDGTRVPYFVVWPQGAKADASNPTLLYGYGGYEISLNPSYSAAFGRAWALRGGVRVVANIRGGGEFGPNWHQAAMKQNKQRSYDDFIAVAEDLIAQKITTPKQLGIMGGSNGGLLVGAAFTQRPELFNAVVCQVPLLDMRRFNQLLAGASWMAEYGNPDVPAEWAYISQYSPYQNLKPGAKYPKVLFTTSTRDDRVHPAHARKMVARMQAQGHEVLYYENIEGGHGGAADNEQRAHLLAMEFAYLWQQLGK
jgi:prolyl oligopeptidase